MDTLLSNDHLAIIGAGTMGETLISALLDAELLDTDQITATNLSESRNDYLRNTYGVAATADNAAAVKKADVVLICLKPQAYGGWLEEVNDVLRNDQLVISIMAGVTIEKLSRGMQANPPIVRVMPNTPAQIRAGMTAIAGQPGIAEQHLQKAEAIFNAVGRNIQLEEKHFDAVTSLSASGPAFIYVVLEAMAEGGVQTGLPRSVSTELVAQTALGAAKMIIETGTHPAILKDHVTTPAGCTIDGLLKLEEGGLRVALIKAVAETAKRAAELGNE